MKYIGVFEINDMFPGDDDLQKMIKEIIVYDFGSLYLLQKNPKFLLGRTKRKTNKQS